MCFWFQFQLRNPWMLGTFLCVPAKLVPSVLLTVLTSLLFVPFTLSETFKRAYAPFLITRDIFLSASHPEFPLSTCRKAASNNRVTAWILYYLEKFLLLFLCLQKKKKVVILTFEYKYKLAENTQIKYCNLK